MSTTYALELKDVRKNFGKTEIIRGVNLAVQAGERVAVIGPNGAGKSTLFNLISGRFGPTSGDILLNGQAIQHKKPYEINRMGLSRSFQITNIFPKLSVFENLRCAVLWSLGYKYTFFKFLSGLKDANARAEQLLDMIHLDKKRDVLAMNLTYAEQRALEIGVTIAGAAAVGGIAAGKSAVAERFAAHGLVQVDADRIARATSDLPDMRSRGTFRASQEK